MFAIINEHTRQPVENPVERVLREGVVVGLANHTVLIAKDGTERPIDDSAAPIRDAAGRMLGVVLIFRDVTEQRRVERHRNVRLAVTQALGEAATAEDGANAVLRRGARAPRRDGVGPVLRRRRFAQGLRHGESDVTVRFDPALIPLASPEDQHDADPSGPPHPQSGPHCAVRWAARVPVFGDGRCVWLAGPTTTPLPQHPLDGVLDRLAGASR